MVGFGAFWSLTAPNHHSLSYWKWLGSNKQQNHLLWCPTDRFNWYRAVKLQNDKTHHKITKVIQMKPSKFCVMTDQNVSHISSLSLCKPNLIRFLNYYFFFLIKYFQWTISWSGSPNQSEWLNHKSAWSVLDFTDSVIRTSHEDQQLSFIKHILQLQKSPHSY